MPINLKAVRQSLGVNLVVQYGSDRHGELRRNDSGQYEIVVYKRSTATPWRSRDRFTVAHEIGHFIVETKIGYHPTSRSEYWKLEDRCNSFAGQLLIPDDAVGSQSSRFDFTPVSVLDALESLAQQTDASLEATARRLVPSLQDRSSDYAIVVGEVTREVARFRRQGQPSPIAYVRWSVGSRTVTPLDFLGPRAIIRTGSPAEPFAARILRTSPHSVDEVRDREEPDGPVLACRALGAGRTIFAALARTTAASLSA